MNIKFSKVIINGVDVTHTVKNVFERVYSYRVEFEDRVGRFEKSSVTIIPPVFDITKYKFSCEGFYDAVLQDEVVEIEGDYGVCYTINKEDSIALAKAHGVKPEDLE